MDRLKKSVDSFASSLERFKEAFERAQKMKDTSEYSFYRDSAIQRFEFTFGTMWRAVKYFLENEGITCRSPRSCIREFFSAGFLSEDETRLLLKMIDDRNLTVHTYRESIAEEIFSRFSLYLPVFEKVLSVVYF